MQLHNSTNRTNTGIRQVSSTSDVEDEIQDVAGGYESMITASPHVAPANSSRWMHDERSVSPPRYHAGNTNTIAPAIGSAGDQKRSEMSSTCTKDITNLTSLSQGVPRGSFDSDRSSKDPNFSMVLNGSPGRRKHCPSPLELGENSSNSSQPSSGLRQSKSKIALIDKMKAVGRNSPRSPQVVAEPEECY